MTAAGVTKATATATIANGQVTGIIVTNGGTGYSAAPNVSVTGGGGSQCFAVANINPSGAVTNIAVTSNGSGYTTVPTVTISGLSVNDIDAKDSTIFLKTDPTVNTTYRTAMSGTPLTAWSSQGWNATIRSHAVGASPIGSACNTNGNSGSCSEVLVDPETGAVEVIGLWNCVDTGRTVYKLGTIKEMLSGCELIITQTLYYGDIYDPNSGAMIGSQYTESQVPTALDVKDVFTVTDVESDDAGGPFGAHGIGEPCSSNTSSIYCAVFNAIGVFPDMDHGAMTPNKVLKALGKA